jgi:hypothetical protein
MIARPGRAQRACYLNLSIRGLRGTRPGGIMGGPIAHPAAQPAAFPAMERRCAGAQVLCTTPEPLRPLQLGTLAITIVIPQHFPEPFQARNNP